MKLVRLIGYLLLFVVSFVFFLYWSFPYDMLKDRLVTAIEQQLGGDVAVSIDTFEPYYFTGVALEKLTLRLHEGERVTPMLTVDEAYGRFSVFSLLVGRARLKATIETGKGKIRLVVRRGSETDDVDLWLDDVDLGSFGLIEARSGIRLTSRIDGEISFRLDRQRFLRTTGDTDLNLRDISLLASELHLGELVLPLPQLALAKGGGSKIVAAMEKGALSVETLRLAGGDLGLDLKGKIFLSPDVENYRLNVSGSFTASKPFADAFPFLFIVDKQKRADGSYPLSVTGRLGKPVIKIGTYTVPL